MSHAMFNRRWATVLTEVLTRHGVQHICIAPGSRSAPLALAASANKRVICHTHFDERGLGFLALGLAKSTGQRVAIVVTSGTAVANLYPALVESFHSGEKLIAITADRPVELVGCGANQAIEQQGMFASHVGASLNLPRPSPDVPARWLIAALDTLLAQQKMRPVHINCPFAEPLYGEENDAFQAWSDAPGSWWQERQPWLRYQSATASPVMTTWPAMRQLRGVVIAGRVSVDEGKEIARWAKQLGWPVLADVLSQTGQPLPSVALWLNHPDARQLLERAELVVQFGSALTSRALLQFQQHSQIPLWWLIDPLPGQRDPACNRAFRIESTVADWLAAHPAAVGEPWCVGLAELASKTRRYLTEKIDRFGEALLALRLPELFPACGVLFLGNSLAIRLVDAFAQLPVDRPVYSNRGASGIDGLIATAAGVQRGSKKPLLLLLGDLSALYDLNSLALLKQATASVVVLVINNQGGQIFSLLPTPEHARAQLFCMPPQVDFSHAASAFGLQYQRVECWESLTRAVKQGFTSGVSLIEVVCQGGEGAQTLRRALKEVAEL